MVGREGRTAALMIMSTQLPPTTGRTTGDFAEWRKPVSCSTCSPATCHEGTSLSHPRALMSSGQMCPHEGHSMYPAETDIEASVASVSRVNDAQWQSGCASHRSVQGLPPSSVGQASVSTPARTLGPRPPGVKTAAWCGDGPLYAPRPAAQHSPPCIPSRASHSVSSPARLQPWGQGTLQGNAHATWRGQSLTHSRTPGRPKPPLVSMQRPHPGTAAMTGTGETCGQGLGSPVDADAASQGESVSANSSLYRGHRPVEGMAATNRQCHGVAQML